MVKNMKKVICGILCMLMVFSMFTVSAATLKINEADIDVSDADATTGLRIVTIPYTLDVGPEEEAPAYLTMLASKTETVNAEDINASAIGIEQIANDSAVNKISFVTDKLEEGVIYYVKMGATNLAEPAKATFTLGTTGGETKPDPYTVTFLTEADATSVCATKTTDAAGKVEAPTAPTKDGYTFAGWATTPGATESDVDFATKVFTADTTLYAVWTAVSGGDDDDDDDINVQYGNVNGDTRINFVDAALVLQSAAGTVTLTDAQKIAANVNGDTRINFVDAALILQYAAGTITEFPVEKQ